MIIDVHVHCAPTSRWLSYDPVNDRYYRWITASQLIARMKKEGIDRAVVLPIQSPETAIEPITSQEAIAMSKRHRGKLIPFCNPDPRLYMGVKKALSLILEEYKQAGCKGVGEVTANIHFDDPKALTLFGLCEQLELPLLFHIGPQIGGCYGLVDDMGLPRLEKVLRTYPDLKFIGHSQPFWSEISGDLKPEDRNSYPKGKVVPGGRAVELLRDYPNLYADLSAGSGYNAISRDREFGIRFLDEFQDKLLFGTDLDYMGQELPQVGYLQGLYKGGRISRKVHDKIMYRNALRVLRLSST